MKGLGYKPGSTWTTDPLFMKEGANYYFYHNDHLGTPQKLTSTNGAVAWSATYTSFLKAEVDSSSTIENNLRAAGQYFDDETGLHYNKWRYYDQNIGRYQRTDPIIGINSTINLYKYCFNDPIHRIDPLGLKSCNHKCMKIFMFPFWKETGSVDVGVWFDRAYALKCYYKKYRREQLRWFIKDFYRCVRYTKDECDRCVKDGVYYTTDDRATSKTFWSRWKHIETITREPGFWNPIYAGCPTDIPNYRGKHPVLLPD